jgi:hypothetical protein
MIMVAVEPKELAQRRLRARRGSKNQQMLLENTFF